MRVVRGGFFWQLVSTVSLATETTGGVILVAFWPKMTSEAISECLILKFSWGSMPPDPPSFFRPQWPYQSKIAGSGPDFLDHKISWSQNFLVNPHSIPMPNFHAQTYSIPVLCSTPFHSNWSVMISWSVTVSTYLHPKSATPCCCRLSVHWEQLQYFTDDVGSRVI